MNRNEHDRGNGFHLGSEPGWAITLSTAIGTVPVGADLETWIAAIDAAITQLESGLHSIGTISVNAITLVSRSSSKTADAVIA